VDVNKKHELSKMKTSYPTKIIVAWGESISGNSKIRDWLMANGYPELGIFVHALNNQNEARKWLLDNNHPHLMALINGCEGNINAINWLKKFEFDVLAHMALAADNHPKAYTWLIENDFREWAIVAEKIRLVKNDLDRRNNDVHSFSTD
jgi:hypothetical protein